MDNHEHSWRPEYNFKKLFTLSTKPGHQILNLLTVFIFTFLPFTFLDIPLHLHCLHLSAWGQQFQLIVAWDISDKVGRETEDFSNVDVKERNWKRILHSSGLVVYKGSLALQSETPHPFLPNDNCFLHYYLVILC